MARVLIVDDALFARILLRKIFTEAGHEVVGEASTGKEAVELYSKLRPDIVTLDIIMPDMDGITALREIKKIDPNAKVIMITSVDSDKKLIECIEAGASGYIVKPFEPSQVLKEVERVLSGQE
ncbi:response regulator [Thermococcus sp. AM4]|uniref:response regulator n=1 Tax=Thermococcus sp. (strain AM4) TaxID=246969 RepID=UPI0001871332|nr:response regulator [Thermococcus sp. AM4]EEB74145.1 chemotaxis response regulator protein-glutamate methylesterase [Thermococcus sp. AM4]